MALMADQQDVVVVLGEPPHLVVHLGHQRTGGVDGAQLRARGLLVHLGRDAVGGEHDERALGNLRVLLDEDRPARLEGADDVQVVDDLLAHVDRRAVVLEGVLDRLDGAVDACAVAARLGEQHAATSCRIGGSHPRLWYGQDRWGTLDSCPRCHRPFEPH